MSINQWDFPYLLNDPTSETLIEASNDITGGAPNEGLGQAPAPMEMDATSLIPEPYLSRKDSILQKVQEKQLRLGKTGNVGPALNGMPYALLSENDKIAAIELQQMQETFRVEAQERAQREASAYVTDRGLDTFSGGATNIAAKFKSGMTTLAGQAVATPIVVTNAYNRAGLTKKDFDQFQVVVEKELAGVPLTPAETALKEEENNTNYQGNTYKTKSKYEKIKDLQAGQLMLDSVEGVVTDYNKTTNNKLTDTALGEVKQAAKQASKEIFDDGDVLKGTWTALKGLEQLVVGNFQATVELTAEMLPTMLALATKAVVTAPVLIASEYESAINEFSEEYGRPPDNTESALAGLLVTGAVLLDTLGAKATLTGKKTLKGIVTSAEKLGIKLPTNTIKRAEDEAQKQTKSKMKKALGIVKKVAKPVGKVAGVAAIEGGTEGVQSVLSQYAGVQDIDKISTEDVIADTIVGSAVGGTIKASVDTAAAVPGATNKTKEAVGELASKRADYLAKQGVGDIVKIVEEATKSGKPDVALAALQNVDLTTLTPEDRINHLVEMQKQIKIHDTQGSGLSAKDRTNYLTKKTEYARMLDESVKAHHKLNEAKTTTPTTSQVSAEEVVEDVDVSSAATERGGTKDIGKSVLAGNVTPETVERIYGSTDFQKLPEQDKKIVSDYMALQTTQNKLLSNATEAQSTPTTDAVHRDIIQGGEGFIGVEQHINNARLSATTGDNLGVNSTLATLLAFKEGQLNKLDPTHPKGTYTNTKGDRVPHTLSVRERILDEVSYINAAIEYISNMATSLTPSVQTEADKPEVAKEGAAKKAESAEGVSSNVSAPKSVVNDTQKVKARVASQEADKTVSSGGKRPLSMQEQLQKQLTDSTSKTTTVRGTSNKTKKQKAQPQYRKNIHGALQILRACGA